MSSLFWSYSERFPVAASSPDGPGYEVVYTYTMEDWEGGTDTPGYYLYIGGSMMMDYQVPGCVPLVFATVKAAQEWAEAWHRDRAVKRAS